MDIFSPKSIAIVGASSDKTKIGAAIFSNLINAGYQGRIFPVNPKRKKINGAKSYPKVSDIPEDVEMAVISIPVAGVEEVVKDCVNKGVKTAVVISAGYSEMGEEGLERERTLQQLVKESELQLVGPNCLGIISPRTRLNASFASHMPQDGNVAFLSQSGAFNTALLDMSIKRGLGFSHFASIGNKIDINEVDLLEEWLNDEQVKVIGMYLEEFNDGHHLIELAQKAKKPIVILHPGESEQAQAAIASHTGSLADAKEVVKAALQKGNLLQVENVEQMFNTLQFFSVNAERTFGKRVALVTNAGGPGVITTDLIEKHNLEMVELSDGLRSHLGGSLPVAASTHNPIDLLGDARADRYQIALQSLVESPEVDVVISLLTPQYTTEIEETAKAIVDIQKKTDKLILPIFLGGKDTDKGLVIVQESGLVGYAHLNDAVDALAAAARWQTGLQREIHSVDPSNFTPLQQILDLESITTEEEKPLSYLIIKQLAEQVGILLPAEVLVKEAEEAVRFADATGYPVVVKATADQIVHKTDQKAIYLNLKDDEQVTDAVHFLQGMLYNNYQIEQAAVLVQEQLDFSGLELIMGIKRSRNFGPILLFGSGGIYTEVFQDVSSVMLPSNHDELVQLINSTKVSQIIKGARTGKQLAFEKLVAMLGQLQLLALTYPQISAIDINPVIVNEEVAIAADLKIFVQK